MLMPRLTGTLRAFSTKSPCLIAKSGFNQDGRDLDERRKAERARKYSQSFNWSTLKTKICDAAANEKARMEVDRLLKDFKQTVRELVGSDASFDAVDGAAVFIFELLHNCEIIHRKHMSELRRLFGDFEPELASRARDCVARVESFVSGGRIDEIIEENKRDSAHVDAPSVVSNVSFEFMSEFEFGQPLPLEMTVEFEDLNRCGVSEKSVEVYSIAISSHNPTATKKLEAAIVQKYDLSWLKKEIKQYFGRTAGGSFGSEEIRELCLSTLRTLNSDKSDEELQNELFDLLGFDRFELIQKLLRNRTQLVKKYLQQACGASQTIKGADNTVAGQNIGIGVKIQTEDEKDIKRLMRREEKKSRKTTGFDVGDDDEIDFSPKTLREKREFALMAAISTPIFSNKSSVRHQAIEAYPNVYDSFLDAKNSAGFVSGVKMMIPAGFERTNNSKYEEISVPPSGSAPPNVPPKLIEVSSLDEIGRVAFSGTERLNRIQSIVFHTAYNTNENLLICAPTGAGKTNVAMLSIVREIRQNLNEEGKLQLHKFKIVYIAPMKALAAEMVRNFGRKLEPLGVRVRELTGDMQLTKTEIKETQILVTTPEKWDVVTRKSTGDSELALLVKLIIIDEVHLLHGDRGPVLESLVARTLRQVEASQTMIRIVGLSATLPNYVDVAAFLGVNPYIGLFFFDGRFRPVPLEQAFVGIKALGIMQQMQDMDNVCYDKVLKMVQRNHQVMVFVHARNATVKTATILRDMANSRGDSLAFSVEQSPQFGNALKQMSRSRNQQLREVFPGGFGFHHAGMLRQDRNLVEQLFADGLIRVLVCTATLAWGVNLPAHAVIIKGTELYDAKHGTYVDLGILDVMQIFGRAGRPQYDTSGHGTILTTHDKLAHYLSLLTCQYPIESQLIQYLEDNLNAEVSLGTVTSVDEAIVWLSYTYLYVRLRRNPQAYGIKYDVVQRDPELINERRDLIVKAARVLNAAKMIRFEERTGYLNPTDLGRTASHYYIKHNTIEIFNEKLNPIMNEADLLAMISLSQEFDQVKVRDDELAELDQHVFDDCELRPIAGGAENPNGKVNILIQTHISRSHVNCFSLVSDQAYVVQNAARIVRALFDVVLRKGWSLMAGRLLVFSKVLEQRLWSSENPLRQFRTLSFEILSKIENRNLTIDRLREMDATEIGHMIHHVNMGQTVKRCVEELPALGLEASIQPITRNVLRVRLVITPEFRWNDQVHGRNAESFWIWVEDPDSNEMYHHEFVLISKKQVHKGEPQTLVFTIPIHEPLPTQYLVRAESDRWLGSQTTTAISFKHLILPERHLPHTDLLDLRPLPVSALQDVRFEKLYNFTHFNPIQTQIFYTLYHTDENVLLGAPTGSGKTIVAEVAMFRVFREYPNTKVVYIAPLKALVRERIEDWRKRFVVELSKKVVELTGDVTPDLRAIEAADVIVTTPEKWDGISRSWQTRNYVKSVSLIVIDEIHLLGEDRGPVLEVIVSRTNYISSHTKRNLRIIGLSTALANARDLADWLGIKDVGLYNFRPSVRPVPMEVHIQGFPGKHYCPRMATMNKPTYQGIRTHSPNKPALIFVASRRQTRLTALDLIAYLAAESNPKQWLHAPEDEMAAIIDSIKESNLKLILSFGIAIHHAGLHEMDRRIVEELFVSGKIQVLIATATLAWGVNFPAHLVIVKGTEYYDGKTRRYVDFPITDVLQMIGRAGRPQFDDQGVAIVLVQDVKKHFYKKFLYEPFPVESCLLMVLPEHLNAEIVAGTISSKQDAMDYLSWTYFYNRLLQNPTYYGLEDVDAKAMNMFLSRIIEQNLQVLEGAGCISIDEDNRHLEPTTIGRIASFYYLNCKTVQTFTTKMGPETTVDKLLEVLCAAHEYEEMPVRHNEDAMNCELAKNCPIEVNAYTYDSPHTKTHLLFQAHFSRIQLPCTDYLTDLKSALDQSIRVLQAMVDIAADHGWLCTTLNIINLIQMIIQGRWLHDGSLSILPHIDPNNASIFSEAPPDRWSRRGEPIAYLPQLMDLCNSNYELFARMLRAVLVEAQIEEAFQCLSRLPIIETFLSIRGSWDHNLTADGDKQTLGSYVEGALNPIPMGPMVGKRPDSCYTKVYANREYVLCVQLKRMNRLLRHDSKAFSPRFPKGKDEGWIVVLGNVECAEVLALKRTGFVSGTCTCQLVFYAPETPGRVVYTLYVMSDSYLGLDQQFDVGFDVAALPTK